MWRFKATFSTFFYGSNTDLEDRETDTVITRIFDAQSLDCARMIAEAMVGEGIYYLEHLHRVLNVQETDQECHLCTWDQHSTWIQAYRKLKDKGESVRLVMDRQENAIGLLFD